MTEHQQLPHLIVLQKMWFISLIFGSVAVGRQADLVIWNGDPLEVTSRPVKMMIDGAWVSLTTRQTLLRDRYADLQDTEIPFGYR